MRGLRDDILKNALFVALVLFNLLSIPQSFSWSAVGHRLIAQIAYDNLSRQAKITFNRYNRELDQGYMSKSFVNSSVWLDTIRWRTHDYDAMHYIDIPFSTDGTPLPPVQSVNAVWAVQTSIKTLSNSDSTTVEKGTALRILVHVVGDLHQPLHAATRVSRQYPEGDRGGNLVILHKNRIAKNLHAYWDKGAGLFVGKRRYGQAWIKQKAIVIEQHWPCNMRVVDMDAMHWALESNALAVQKVYLLRDKNYQHMAQQIVEQRIAIAGCRLAGLMNQLRPNDSITAPKNRVASPPVIAR